MEDDRYPTQTEIVQAREIIAQTGRASISGVQRRLKISYLTAAKIIEILEADGLVSKPSADGSRQVKIAEPKAIDKAQVHNAGGLAIFIALASLGVLAILASTLRDRQGQNQPPRVSASAEQNRQTQNQPSSPVATAEQDSAWVAAMEERVRQRLKDPASAIFTDTATHHSYKGIPVVCGRINSKNSFGGYTGAKRFVASGQVIVIEGETMDAESMTRTWEQTCR
jgi:hypothetical protein